MLPLLLVALLSVRAASVELEECEPEACANENDCYTFQPQDEVTSSAPTWEEPLPGPCQPNPCHHGGVCEISPAHPGDVFLGYQCHCSPGYTGLHCQHNVNECESGPCRNGGVCTDLAANYSCLCPEEFTGRNCQQSCCGPLGMEGAIIADSQLSASSSFGNVFGLRQWRPHLARLHRTGLVNAWIPAESDRRPWIQVTLRRPLRLTGIITQGARRLGRAEFVRSFRVAYGNSGATWTVMKSKDTLQDTIFNGNTDNNSPVGNSFSPPIEAEFVRVYPHVCQGRCSLRMELLGCELTGCSEPLGLKAGLVLDSQMSASSVHRTLGMGLLAWGPGLARLDRRGKVNAWGAARRDRRQWIQVDLLGPCKVTGVITQGARDLGRVQFVSSYKLAYSNDGVSWTVHQDEGRRADKVFLGNHDNRTHKKNDVAPPIFGRFLRLIPWSWHGRITLRMEILGCSQEE